MALKLHKNIDAQLSPVKGGIKIEKSRFGAFFVERNAKSADRRVKMWIGCENKMH